MYFILSNNHKTLSWQFFNVCQIPFVITELENILNVLPSDN